MYAVPLAPPAMPGIQASYTATNGSVTISWSAVGGAASYDYQVAAGSVLSTASTSVTLTGLSVGSTAFKLRATNGAGSSAYASASIVNPLIVPSAPVLLPTYTTAGSTITITWSAVSGASRYDYQIGTGSVLSTTSTSVTLSGLSVGTTTLKVRAVNTAGSSAYATTSVARTPAAPGTPVLSATYGTTDGNVVISWPAVSGAERYDYQVGSGAVVSTTATSVALSGLAAGSTTFKLRAANAGGPGAYSTATIVNTPPVPLIPGVPTLGGQYPTADGNVTISWPTVPGATTYQYQVGAGVIMEIPDTNVSLFGVASGVTSFKVRAVNSVGTSAWTYTSVNSTVPRATPVLRITILKTAKHRLVTIKGTASGGEPTGRVTIRVSVRVPGSRKSRVYTYYADWTSSAGVGTFSKTVRVPRAGNAFVTVSADGAKVSTRSFKIKR